MAELKSLSGTQAALGPNRGRPPAMSRPTLRQARKAFPALSPATPHRAGATVPLGKGLGGGDKAFNPQHYWFSAPRSQALIAARAVYSPDKAAPSPQLLPGWRARAFRTSDCFYS